MASRDGMKTDSHMLWPMQARELNALSSARRRHGRRYSLALWSVSKTAAGISFGVGAKKANGRSGLQ